MKLLYYGKPLAQTKVSFIPRGAVLSTDFDKTYERKTDQDGIVSFEPKEANLYLIVSHFEREERLMKRIFHGKRSAHFV